MISSDDYPPSDHHNQETFHDFKINYSDDIDLIKSFVADLDDTNNTYPSFSIRDYVFNSRNKGIAGNWPFSHKKLQICLEHGVKNLLPPFQSLESLRNINQSNEEIIINSDEKSNPKVTLESRNTIPSGSKGDKESKQDSGQQKSKKAVISSWKTSNTSVEPIEEIKIMASKVCPVCKTYSSSSNTTLNAHIDQCLSCESNMKWTANPKVVVVKHRIKPRKTRLMVDIYKTAPHCTVEELDARNGTSWANNSSFPDQELEFHVEEEKADHEGDVYIDKDGTKVRILSVPKVGSSDDDFGARAARKGGKPSKSFAVKKKKKNHEHKHRHRYLKLSTNSKKLCSAKTSEVTSGREENVGVGKSCNMDDRGKAPIKMVGLPIVRPPWACAKRTSLAKKLHGLKTPSTSSNKTATFSQQNHQKIETSPPTISKKRSRLLKKPSSEHLKKESTLLQNNREDHSDAYPSKRSKGSDVGSKGSKFLSSVKILSSKSKEKRKVSLKQRSRIEEDSCRKTSSENMNLLEVRKNEEIKILSSSPKHDDMFESQELYPADFLEKSMRIDDLTCYNEKQQNDFQGFGKIQLPTPLGPLFVPSDGQHFRDTIDREYSMSDSPNSTVSNPSLARSDSDKFSITNLGDRRLTNSTAFKNDHPCRCSRKETSSYHESTHVKKHVSPKPVLRLMGKNLTVVNTDEELNCGQFSNVQNEHKFSSVIGYHPQHPVIFDQNLNGFNKSQHPHDHLRDHALDTMFRSTTFTDYYVHGSAHVGPVIPQARAHQDPIKEIIAIDDSPENGCNRMPFGYQSQSLLAVNNGGFQACSPFMEVENNGNLARWNYKPTSCSSRSSAMYYPPSFS